MKNENLIKNFKYYLNHKEEFIQNSKYYQKYITIKDENVVGCYNTEEEAIKDMLKKGYKLGEFIVQLVAINDGTKANFVSNVYV